MSRVDGRSANQIRGMCLQAPALDRPTGSVAWKAGATELLAAAYAPVDARRTRLKHDRAIVDLNLRPSHGMPTPRERALEAHLASALDHLVLTARYPRTTIAVIVQVLCDDGSLLSAALHAACAALRHAGVELRGLGGGCTIALTPTGAALLDPTADEERDAATLLSLAFLTPGGGGGDDADDAAGEPPLLLSQVGGSDAVGSFEGIPVAEHEQLMRAAKAAAAAVASFTVKALAAQEPTDMSEEMQAAVATQLAQAAISGGA